MAGGWTRDGAVGEQIEATISDELARLRARAVPQGESLSHCAECAEPIPEARRAAIPGVKLCLDCMEERDSHMPAQKRFNLSMSKNPKIK